ncbi:hypothetical protein BC826DRAFT_285375 [Russula brevipes]|nr:hypothetical protein BC826DRAFT_285375 [Russula brevipes]
MHNTVTRMIFQSPEHRLHHTPALAPSTQQRTHFNMEPSTPSRCKRLLTKSDSHSHYMPPGVHVVAPPAAKPATNLPPSYTSRFSLRQPTAMYCAAVSRSLGSSQLHAHAISRRGCGHERRGISPNYDDACHPRRGGSPSEEPGTLRFATRVCWTSTKRVSCRTEIVASPRRIRKAHRAPSTRGAFPCATPFPFFSQIRLLRPRPAPPQWPAAHSRGSAPHHLINI